MARVRRKSLVATPPQLDGSLYDYPAYYDLVFGSDWRAEFRFLRACFARYARGSVRSVFEPACGTGRLLFRLAKAGYVASGLDLNSRAVDYCNSRLERHGLPATVYVADMSDFSLKKPVDACFNMINSFRHLLSEDAAVAHLNCVAASLRVGGLYVLGLHLTPTEGSPMDEEAWSARRGNLLVNTRLKTVQRNPKRREERFSMTCDVYTPTALKRLREEIVFRSYTLRQFQTLLAKLPNLETAGCHDFTYDAATPTRLSAASEDVVVVLRKT